MNEGVVWPLLFPKNISAEIPSRLLRSSDDDDDDDADDSDDEKFSTVSFLSTKIFSDHEESDSDGGDFEE